jgi:hypothetical protein
MKLLCALCLLGALVFAGCSDKSSSSGATSNSVATNAGSPLTAPVDYLRAVGNGQQSAIGTVDTTSLDKAIQLFNVDQGRNPTDLNELVQKKYIPKLPAAPSGMKLVYDANAGKVTLEKQ